MGWVHDVPEDNLYDHEGYAVAVLADGTEPGPVQVQVLFGEGTTASSTWWHYDGKQGRPLAAAVKAGCSCGWRSKGLSPVDFDNLEATEGFEFNDGPYWSWTKEHINALLGTAMPQDLSEALETVKQFVGQLATERPLVALTAIGRLEKMIEVHAPTAGVSARSQMITWEAIGKALRTSRQAAYQRFGKYVTDPAQRAGTEAADA